MNSFIHIFMYNVQWRLRENSKLMEYTFVKLLVNILKRAKHRWPSSHAAKFYRTTVLYNREYWLQLPMWEEKEHICRTTPLARSKIRTRSRKIRNTLHSCSAHHEKWLMKVYTWSDIQISNKTSFHTVGRTWSHIRRDASEALQEIHQDSRLTCNYETPLIYLFMDNISLWLLLPVTWLTSQRG